MRCILCEKLSFPIICNKCQNTLLIPSFYKRELKKDFFVYSFYNYEEIKNLLNSKYQFYGDKIYNILATHSLKKFGDSFEYPQKVFTIPIDDHTRHEFSHTAILANKLKSHTIIPLFNKLKAKNIVKYAGRDLVFRKKNRRDFVYSGNKNIQVILVDDLVTTGLTILEAKEILEKNGCEVLFALTLSDAKF